ncbi:MBL fold metallo-hydrolase [soil metagenome]
MFFRQIVEEKLAQNAYLIGCQRTGEALLVDPERDIDRYVALAEREGLKVTAIAETHIHADFLSGAREFAERGVRVYLSDEGDADWKYGWATEGDHDVVMLRDGDTFRVGNVRVEARHTPGHTSEHLSFLVTDEGGGADEPMGMVSGDFVFVGAVGRPDLLETAAGQAGAREPAARSLYASVQDFLTLPDYLQVWPGHGAGSACGKALGSVPDSTVGYERRFNPSLATSRQGERAFVESILDGQPETPIYFARMKRLNKEGPPVLGDLPRPSRIDAVELAELAGRTDVAVVDTRADRSAFMREHLAGSLHAPLDGSFPTLVGSYVEPDTPVYLLVEEARVEEAVRDLVRVGIDRIAGYAPAEVLNELRDANGALASTEEISTRELERRRQDDNVAVVDVRRLDEYREGHVPGARLAPHVRLPEYASELPNGRTLLVHCAGGVRAAAAAAYLERSGHDVVYVNGRFSEWADAHPAEVTEGERAPEPARASVGA